MTDLHGAGGSGPNSSDTLDPLATFADSALWSLLASSGRGVLMTIRRDGRPQASNIGYTYDPATRIARIIAPSFRAKTRNLRRDTRASIHVTNADQTLWAVADGEASLTPVCVDADDAVGREVISIYDLFGVTGEAREHLVTEAVVGRVVISVRIDRVYGGDARDATSRSD